MLKIPKVSFETIAQITEKFADKEINQEELTKNFQNVIEGFASEQPALLTMVSKISDLGEEGYMVVATLVWKAIKDECENSVLESFMDVK